MEREHRIGEYGKVWDDQGNVWHVIPTMLHKTCIVIREHVVKITECKYVATFQSMEYTEGLVIGVVKQLVQFGSI